jgi:outer membrane murein-binding lipoprotein Lpp
MSALEDRVTTVEVKMDDVKTAIIDLKAAIAALDQKMDRRFDRVESRN